MWCATWPAMMYAKARTLTGLPLAMPVRLQASWGKLWKNAKVAARTALKSATWLAQEN